MFDVINSYKMFSDEKLPDRHEFCSSFKGECINNKKKKINCIETFIGVCLEYYGLELCHHFSSHGLSWDAMLKITSVELELISD